MPFKELLSALPRGQTLKLRAAKYISMNLSNADDHRAVSKVLNVLSSLAVAGGSKMVQTNLGTGLKPAGEQDY